MRRMKISALVIVCVLLLSFQTGGGAIEEFKQELKAMKKVMDGMGYYEIQTSYKMYNSATGKLFESVTGRYVKKGKNTYNKMAFVENVRSEQHELVIDNAHHFIVIDTMTEMQRVRKMSITGYLDTLDFSKVMSVKPYQVTTNVKGYELRFKGSAAGEKFSLEYDAGSKLPKRLIMQLSEKVQGSSEDDMITPKVEVEFVRYVMQDEGGGRLTDPGYYVGRKSGKWVVINEQYKGYSIKKSY